MAGRGLRRFPKVLCGNRLRWRALTAFPPCATAEQPRLLQAGRHPDDQVPSRLVRERLVTAQKIVVALVGRIAQSQIEKELATADLPARTRTEMQERITVRGRVCFVGLART